MKKRFYLNGLLDLYSIFLYRAIQRVRTEASIDVVSNGSADGELSKRNVNQANVMRSLSPCTFVLEYQNRIARCGDRR
jgi:hypothetical protein